MDDDDVGDLNIQISDADDAAEGSDRTAQSEADFQAVKRHYRVKVQNGQIHKSIELPLGPAPNKLHVQDVLHAIEELYFFRRYRDALSFIHALRTDGSCQALDLDSRNLILVYERRCQHRLNASS